MRPVRTISRKDGISGREDQEGSTEDWVLPGGLYRRGRQLQRFVWATQGLSRTVEDLSQLQRIAEGSGHTGPLQAALGVRHSSRPARWCVVLRDHQPDGPDGERNTFLREVSVLVGQEEERLREVQADRFPCAAR